MQTKNAAVHFIFEKLFDNLRQVVKPTSKRPAIIKIIQFMINVFLQIYRTFVGLHFTNVKKCAYLQAALMRLNVTCVTPK